MTYSELKKYLNYVDLKIQPAMKELLNSGVDKETKQVVFYQILTGGKRVRPALAIASCKMFGIQAQYIYPLVNYLRMIEENYGTCNSAKARSFGLF